MKKELQLLTSFLLCIQILCLQEVNAQDNIASIKPLHGVLQQSTSSSISLREAIGRLENHFKVSFIYETEMVEGKVVVVSAENKDSFEEAAKKLLVPLNLTFVKIGDRAYHIRPIAKEKNVEKIDRAAGSTDNSALQDRDLTSSTLNNVAGRGMLLSLLKYDITIKGKVAASEDNQPIPGVNIVVKGTTIGTVSDMNGDYAIKVPDESAVLVFSAIGYLTEEIPLAGRTIIDMKMGPDIKQLSEVIVVGYGTQKKENLTGAVSAVKMDEKITSRSLTNVSSGLSGLVPGLAVTQNTGMAGRNQANLVIRGLGTVNNANPLVVVDGMPDVDINRINMNDIESISILKDAASSAVYGSRAANGVILITTKSGKGQEKTSINYSGSYAVEVPTKAYDFMDDYARSLTLHQRGASVGNRTENQYQTYKYGTIDQWMALGMINPLAYPNTDWWDVIMRNGTVQNHNLSASGSTEKSNFFISVGLMDQQGLQVNNDFSRYNARFNFDFKVRKNMNVGARFSGNWSKLVYALEDGFTDDDPTNTAGFDMQYAIAGITPYDPVTGNFGGTMAFNEDLQAYNPYTVYINNLNRQNRQEVNPMVYWDWSPFSSLTFRIDYALNYYNQLRWSASMPNRSYNFQTNSFGTRWYVGENAGIGNFTETGYKTQLNSRVNYHKVFGKHDVSAMVVYSEEYWNEREMSSTRLDRLHPTLHEIDAALTGTQTAGGKLSTEGLRSYIGRVNYVAFDKYLLEANFRYDGSSKFSEGSRYGFFPSLALGWRFTEEGFLKPLTESWLTEGKLRASYGSLGNNSGVGRYEQQWTLPGYHYMIDGVIAKGLINKKMINPDLSWETSKVLNLGIDLGFFNNRLTAEIDYYDRLTTGMNRPSDLSILLTGAYDAPRRNIGDLRNRGIEGNFAWREKIGKLEYLISVNASHNESRLEKWNELLVRTSTLSGNNIFLNMPFSFLYTYEDDGIAQTWEDIYNATPQGASPGDILRKDLNGDGRINDNDRKAYPKIRRNRPSTNFALTTSVAWNGFDLSVLFQGSTGRKDFWINNYNNVGIGTRYAATWNHWNNPWSWDNRNGEWPRLNGSSNREETTFWLDDMTYLRLKNIQLGYKIPQNVLRKIGVDNARIFGSAENLATFTKYRGLDPEMNGNRSDMYPLNKSYSMGINIGI